MSQTTAPLLYSVLGVPGAIADVANRITDSFAAEGVIAFGAGVERGTDPAKQVVTFAGGDFLGVALFNHTSTAGEYQDKDSVGVLRTGRVIVDTGDVEVTAGEAAYITAAGAFTNVVGTNTLAGEWLSSGAGLNVLNL
ncbi:MAG: hypothetical protein IBX56_19615 [Methylomicrobium sp.]|nr:hypothetical protein [Methylomicrobium sp.]